MTRYIAHCNRIHVAVHMVTSQAIEITGLNTDYDKVEARPRQLSEIVKDMMSLQECNCNNTVQSKFDMRHCFAMAIYIVHSCVPLRISLALDLLVFIGDAAVCLWWTHLHLHVCIFTYFFYFYLGTTFEKLKCVDI